MTLTPTHDGPYPCMNFIRARAFRASFEHCLNFKIRPSSRNLAEPSLCSSQERRLSRRGLVERRAFIVGTRVTTYTCAAEDLNAGARCTHVTRLYSHCYYYYYYDGDEILITVIIVICTYCRVGFQSRAALFMYTARRRPAAAARTGDRTRIVEKRQNARVIRAARPGK